MAAAAAAAAGAGEAAFLSKWTSSPAAFLITIAFDFALVGIWKFDDVGVDCAPGAGVFAWECPPALVGGRLPKLEAGRSDTWDPLRDMLGGW